MTEPHYEDSRVTLWHGDCLDVLRTLPDASVDSVVTDPPYGLEFMGKDWDRPWAVTPTAGVGFEGREENLTLPSHRDGRNANCRACGGRQRGAKRCACAAPKWDRDPAADMREFGRWCEAWATECLRVLKPGGHLLAFGGTRTWHRLACAVEDAGFEVRDSIAWLYGSGFPKSLDVSKAIDKMDATHERRARALRFTAWMRSTGITSRQVDEATGTNMGGHYLTANSQPAVATVAHLDMLRPLLPEVPEWVEDMARQRTVESATFASREVIEQRQTADRRGDGTVVGLGHTGGADVTAPATDAAREWAGWGTALKPAFEPVVVARKPLVGTVAANVLAHGTGALNVDGCRIEGEVPSVPQPADTRRQDGDWKVFLGAGSPGRSGEMSVPHPAGRWPANVVLDEDMAGVLDEQSGTLASQRTRTDPDKGTAATSSHLGTMNAKRSAEYLGETGGASRFFYVAKAPKRERPVVDGVAHPTVKPLSLMRWLVRLVTPPGGTVLEPFAGSGTTVEACIVEGFRCVAIEKGDEYLPLILARIERQSRARVEAEVDRKPDPARAIAEQVARQLDIFGEESA